MKKKRLSISERTKITSQINDISKFYFDLDLFKKTFPYHKLNNELARVNAYNKKRLHGAILYELLSKVSKEDIEKNRSDLAKADTIETTDTTSVNKTDKQSVANSEVEGNANDEKNNSSENKKDNNKNANSDNIEKANVVTSKEKPKVEKKTKGKKKQEEFPKIDWVNNIDPNIQTAILLYDERVNTYHRMQEIDVLIDHQPELAKELVQLDIRNKQAHNELQSFNDKGSFLFIHPLVKGRDFEQKQLENLRILKKTNPAKFLNEVANSVQNMRRIESNIRTKKYKSKNTLLQWKENLQRAEIRYNVLQKILNE